jgi:hypothetical protein
MTSVRYQVLAYYFPSYIVDAQRQTVHGAGMPEYAYARGRRQRLSLNPSNLTDLLTSLSRIIRWGAGLLILSVVTVLPSWAEGNRVSGLLEDSPFGMAACTITRSSFMRRRASFSQMPKSKMKPVVPRSPRRTLAEATRSIFTD